MGLREIAETLINLQKEEKNKNRTFVEKSNIDYSNNEKEIEGENDENIEIGIQKVKEIMENPKIIEEFDSDIFDVLVDYVIIGGYDESGQIDQYMIRFICKSQFELSAKDDISKERIIEEAYLSKLSNRVILDFINRQNIFLYEKDEIGR